jgi:hypothetical protein
LAELLYLNKLSSVYHGETGVRMLRELARSYLTIVKDLTRVMSRLKALYRSWAIPCAGRLGMNALAHQQVGQGHACGQHFLTRTSPSFGSGHSSSTTRSASGPP